MTVQRQKRFNSANVYQTPQLRRILRKSETVSSCFCSLHIATHLASGKYWLHPSVRAFPRDWILEYHPIKPHSWTFGYIHVIATGSNDYREGNVVNASPAGPLIPRPWCSRLDHGCVF
jgi:hypothetical protein